MRGIWMWSHSNSGVVGWKLTRWMWGVHMHPTSEWGNFLRFRKGGALSHAPSIPRMTAAAKSRGGSSVRRGVRSVRGGSGSLSEGSAGSARRKGEATGGGSPVSREGWSMRGDSISGQSAGNGKGEATAGGSSVSEGPAVGAGNTGLAEDCNWSHWVAWSRVRNGEAEASEPCFREHENDWWMTVGSEWWQPRCSLGPVSI